MSYFIMTDHFKKTRIPERFNWSEKEAFNLFKELFLLLWTNCHYFYKDALIQRKLCFPAVRRITDWREYSITYKNHCFIYAKSFWEIRLLTYKTINY